MVLGIVIHLFILQLRPNEDGKNETWRKKKRRATRALACIIRERIETGVNLPVFFFTSLIVR